MPRFNFRLKTLLRLREAARDERRADLAQAYEAEQILTRQTEKLEGEIHAARQQVRLSAAPGGIDVDTLLATHRYELVLGAQRQLLHEQSEQLSAEIQRRRQALVEADREVHVLEKLRQRQLERFKREEGKREMKRIDEVASRRRREEEP